MFIVSYLAVLIDSVFVNFKFMPQRVLCSVFVTERVENLLRLRISVFIDLYNNIHLFPFTCLPPPPLVFCYTFNTEFVIWIIHSTTFGVNEACSASGLLRDWAEIINSCHWYAQQHVSKGTHAGMPTDARIGDDP